MSKTNWIATYGNDQRSQKFQAGGPMGPEAGAPAGPEAGGAPDLEGMLMEYSQTRDPQLAVAICDMLVEMMAAQQGGAPEGAPAEAATPPMARRGMRMAPKF